MKYSIKILVLTTLFTMSAISVFANPEPNIFDGINLLKGMTTNEKIPLDSIVIEHRSDVDEKVIVGNDTVSIILPQKNYGRYDRGLFNYLFIPKGIWSFGLTASYGEFNTEDIQVLSILNNFNIKVKAFSLSPSVSYFITNNQSIGVKFNYQRMYVDLKGLNLDIDEDMNFRLSDISYYSTTYNAALAYRNYVGLGRDRRFGVFNEIELQLGAGSSRFQRSYDGVPRDTRTNTFNAALNFSPGVCVFIMDNVCFNVSFGVFGLQLHREHQTTDGVEEGTRFSSGANFKFNIFNINFGMAVCI